MRWAADLKKERLKPSDDFEQLANEKDPGFVKEFVVFLATNKRWWLTPIVLIFALLALLIVLASTGPTPFIYPFL